MQYNIVGLYLHSRMVCPDYGLSLWKLSGGSVFLVGVIGLFVIYVSGGVIIGYLRKGVVEFPNAAFWSGVVENISVALVFIITCGRS
jgi:hypothetical protein